MTNRTPYAEGSHKRHATLLVLENSFEIYRALMGVVDEFAAGRITKERAVISMWHKAVHTMGSVRIPCDGYKLSKAACRDFLSRHLKDNLRA